TAFHAPEHAPGRAAEPGGPEPWGERTGSGPGIRRRPGLDCDEVPGEGPGAALRDGQWSGLRSQAAPERRTGRGPAAEHGLPTPEDHPPEQTRLHGRGRRRGGACAWHWRQHLAGGGGDGCQDRCGSSQDQSSGGPEGGATVTAGGRTPTLCGENEPGPASLGPEQYRSVA